LARGIEYHKRLTAKYQSEIYPTLPLKRKQTIRKALADLESHLRERRIEWEATVDKEGSDFSLLEESELATEAEERAKVLTGCAGAV
jgi:hypothetical protein